MSVHLAVLQHEPATSLGAFAAQLDAAKVDYELVGTTRDPLPDAGRFDGAIALGGSLGAHDSRLVEARRWIRNTVLAGMPFLGVCLGGQLLASALGAAVKRGHPETGLHDVFLTDAAYDDPIFATLPARFQVFGWHEDSFGLAPGALPLAGSIACTYQAFRFGTTAYGLQFHPEVRAEDLARWRNVPRYRALAERTGASFDAQMIDLRRATPSLDALAGALLQSWLRMVSGVVPLASPREAAA
jgi:GMP synthase (glutamine-hydrolysing)